MSLRRLGAPVLAVPRLRAAWACSCPLSLAYCPCSDAARAQRRETGSRGEAPAQTVIAHGVIDLSSQGVDGAVLFLPLAPAPSFGGGAGQPHGKHASNLMESIRNAVFKIAIKSLR